MALAIVKGGDSDHDEGRDTGDGELIIMVSTMVKMIVMLVANYYFLDSGNNDDDQSCQMLSL